MLTGGKIGENIITDHSQEVEVKDRGAGATSTSTMESPLPQIMESIDDFGGQPKDRLVSILDRIEMHVEQLRKDAIRIEEERDTLLTTLDTLRNNDIVVALEERKLICSIL